MLSLACLGGVDVPNPYEEELEEILAKSGVPATDDTDDVEFKSEAQRLCYARVKEFGRDLFGEMFERSSKPKQPTFFLRFGSSSIAVTVNAWGEDDAMVDVWSWVITNIEMQADLMEYLLRRNYELRFGAFRLDKNDDIHLSHVILGSELDKKELRSSVLAVAHVADEEDDVIKSRWGGKRWVDPSSA